jgi:superfamily II DNA or RNA helicase
MQPSLFQNSINTLNLPPLVFGPIKKSIGIIQHTLLQGGEFEAEYIEKIPISTRISEDLFHLKNGQKIILTKRPNLDRPDNVDGVLRDINGKLKWLSHRLIDLFESDISSKGLNAISREINESWTGQFVFQAEKKSSDGEVISVGLRPPQIGGLHSIGSHWSLYKQPATIVMPTGTGKTETMLAALVAYRLDNLLVVVPSKVLRNQTARKFLTLGLLRQLKNLPDIARNPIVGIITKRPQSEEDLKIIEECNVVVTTMVALSEQSASRFSHIIADKISTLIVDEAHHICALGWSSFKDYFKDRKVLQFTATPFRRDGKLVDGKVIYEYPLHEAQKDGYFKKISFEPIYEIEADNADKAIAIKAIEKLRSDIQQGNDHILMARCVKIERASKIVQIYKSLASDLSPVMVHSELSNSEITLEKLRTRESRIIVCVNMLGEGFDLPQLKIAAVHDTHKSLAILLQFTGRFTRTAGDNIGDATVIANIADQDVSSALERLYSEDADWNELLSEFSSEAARSHSQLIEFLNSSQRLDKPNDVKKIEFSHHLFRPLFSTLMYNADSFNPKKFFEGIPKEVEVHRVWLHEESNTLYFVTMVEPKIKWIRAGNIRDRIWSLHILHFDSIQKILYYSSSDKDSNHEKIAEACGATDLIQGDVIFRSLGNINRLIFQNIGVKKYGRRNLRFALYTGSDVAEALSITERAGSIKSNLSGTGWENGRPITIGCSYKGRVWTREPGSIPELLKWCKAVGKKIKDESINTAEIIANVLIPEEVESLPDKNVLSIEWPIEILRQSEERVVLSKGENNLPISMFDMGVINYDNVSSKIEFALKDSDDNVWGKFNLLVGGNEGFKVEDTSNIPINIRAGIIESRLDRYLSNYPPLIRYLDLSELDGNLLIKPQNTQDLVFPLERFEVWDWTGIDLTKESIWKNNIKREDSIQWKTANHFISGGYAIVFDDDNAGEAADLICLKEEQDFVRLALVHCKFTKGQTAGERIKDVVEVSSQAVRSAKWRWKFKDLCRHILDREKRLTNETRITRFLAGQKSDINKFAMISRFKEIKPEIIIVQPGLSRSNHTVDQTVILAATYSYLKETVGVDLDIICNE